MFLVGYCSRDVVVVAAARVVFVRGVCVVSANTVISAAVYMYVCVARCVRVL